MKKNIIDFLRVSFPFLLTIGLWRLSVPFWNPGGIMAIIPIFFSGAFGADVSFGGTSLIIIVGVVLETLKQIESQMLVRHYRGFINE